MKREIKFRSWNGEKMVYSDEYEEEHYGFQLSNFFEFEVGGEYEQFTGLKDKNEKEIYEGDVIKQRNNGFIMLVEFQHGSFILINKQKTFSYPLGWQTDYESDEMDWADLDDVEIVGNIHQNPELI